MRLGLPRLEHGERHRTESRNDETLVRFTTSVTVERRESPGMQPEATMLTRRHQMLALFVALLNNPSKVELRMTVRIINVSLGRKWTPPSVL